MALLIESVSWHAAILNWLSSSTCLTLLAPAMPPALLRPLPLPACSGGMIFTFYKARGMAVGGSLVEEDKLDLARELEIKAKVRCAVLGM